MDDVVGDGVLFDALGVGLGRQEMYNIALAVKKLGEDPRKSVATVRFFGKFFGLYADYYVFETTLKDTPEIPEAPGAWMLYMHAHIVHAHIMLPVRLQRTCQITNISCVRSSANQLHVRHAAATGTTCFNTTA